MDGLCVTFTGHYPRVKEAGVMYGSKALRALKTGTYFAHVIKIKYDPDWHIEGFGFLDPCILEWWEMMPKKPTPGATVSGYDPPFVYGLHWNPGHDNTDTGRSWNEAWQESQQNVCFGEPPFPTNPPWTDDIEQPAKLGVLDLYQFIRLCSCDLAPAMSDDCDLCCCALVHIHLVLGKDNEPTIQIIGPHCGTAPECEKPDEADTISAFGPLTGPLAGSIGMNVALAVAAARGVEPKTDEEARALARAGFLSGMTGGVRRPLGPPGHILRLPAQTADEGEEHCWPPR
jgi:hypothetical protein